MKMTRLHLASVLMMALPSTFGAVTYNVNLVRYYKDGDLVLATPSFVWGSSGSINSGTQAQYFCMEASTPEGYYASSWWLGAYTPEFPKSGIKYDEWSSPSISFTYTDAIYSKVKTTSLEMLVSIDQKKYNYSYAANGGSWTGSQPEGGKDVKYWTEQTASGAECVSRSGYTPRCWRSNTGHEIGLGAKFTGSDLAIAANGDTVTLSMQWTVNSYVVTCAPGTYGEGTAQQLSKEHGKARTLPGAIFTRGGYEQKGWSYDAAGTKKDFDLNGSYSKDESTTLYPYWEAIEYTITIYPDYDGGSVQTKKYKTDDSDQSISISPPSRTEYDWSSWSSDFSGVTGTQPTVTKTSILIPAGTYGSFSITAKWTGKTYAITVSANGGEGGSSVNYQVSSTAQTVAFANPTRGGYNLSSWSVGSGWSGMSPSVDKSNHQVNIPANTYGSFTITPNWSGKTYSVTVSAGEGGSGGDSTTYTVSGSSQQWDFNPPTRTGYHIGSWSYTGWNKSKPSISGSTLTIPSDAYGDITATPTWAANSFTISYDSEYPAAFRPTSAQYDTVFKETKPIRGDSAFAGWQITEGLDVSTAVYSVDQGATWLSITSDEQKFGADCETLWLKNITAEQNGKIKLYANWSTQYTITVSVEPAAGGTVSGGGQHVGGDTIELMATPNEGYSFEKWQDDPSASATRKIKVMGDATYTACFTGNVYTVTFRPNGGSNEPDDIDVRYGEKYGDLGEPTPPEGKSFSGWFTKKSGGDLITKDTVVSIIPPEDYPIMLYAHYEDIVYTEYYIVFDGNGATNATVMAVQTNAVGVATALNKNEYGKEGATFSGWATDKTGEVVYKDGEKVTDIVAPGKTVTLYAKWTPWKNYVKFIGAGAANTTAMAVQAFDYGVPQALNENKFLQPGCTFLGWTNAVAKAFYTNRQEFTSTQPDGYTNTLKAVWWANRYIIHFAKGSESATGEMADMTDCVSGVYTKLTKCAFTNLCSQGLKYWKDSKCIHHSDGAYFAYNAEKDGDEITLTAVWNDEGDLSRAVGLTNAVLRADGQTGGWDTRETKGSTRGTCAGCDARAISENQSWEMSMRVQGPGTLRFRWKNSGDEDVSACVNVGEMKAKDLCGLTNVWHESALYVGTDGVFDITWIVTASALNQHVEYYIDDVTWQPGAPLPVVITVVANPVKGGNAQVSGDCVIGSTNAVLTALAAGDYEFTGWSDGSGEARREVEVLSNATYTANFEIIHKGLSLSPGRGIASISYSTNDSAYVSTETKVTLDTRYGTKWTAYAVAQSGYSYEETSEAHPTNGVVRDETVVFAPTGTPNRITVAYDGNGKTAGSMNETTFIYDEGKRLASNQFVRTYAVSFNAGDGTVSPASTNAVCTFGGWNSQADGKGACSYADGQLVTNPCGSTGDDVTLFAQWSEVAPIALPTPVRAGFVPTGWYTAAEGGDLVGQPGDNYQPDKTITLFAQWKVQLSDLSVAVGLTNANLIANGAIGGDGWVAQYTGEQGEAYCAFKATAADQVAKMSMTVMGPGTLSFTWKKTGDSDAHKFYLSVGGNAVLQHDEQGSGYVQVSTNIPAGKIEIAWCLAWDSGWEEFGDMIHGYVDDVRWTPDTPSHPVPTEKDARDISAISVSGGAVSLTVTNADERFDYQLRGTNTLVELPWPVMWTTNGTGTIVIEPPKTDDLSMFYYLQTIQKQ